jgi:Ca2+-binding RTX toxin-like protein
LAENSDAMVNTFSDGTLLNKGKIRSGFNRGVLWSGLTNDHITNTAHGSIVGFDIGVQMSGQDNQVLNNYGKIAGQNTYGVELDTTGVGDILSNHGAIFGQTIGVSAQSFNFGVTIKNSGSIKSKFEGIAVSTNPALTTTINNAATGTIQGSFESLSISLGRVHLINHGTMIGAIVDQGTSNDVIVNKGMIKGAVHLGSGNGTFDGSGGTSGTIFGGGGNWHIIAGNGNVTIHVGSGSDTLTGGTGADHFVFDSPLMSQVETITNFKPGKDKIVLSKADFAGIGAAGHPLAAADFHVGPHATKPSQLIVYDPVHGFLFYEGNGSHVHFATIGAHLGLTHADFLVAA